MGSVLKVFIICQLFVCSLFAISTESEKQIIVFQSDRSGKWQIYTILEDGTNLTQLTTGSYDNEYPVWSPDGTKILFKSNRDGGKWNIYVMDADGSNQLRVTASSSNSEDPCWSPDGRKVAFHSDRDHLRQIYIMGLDGSGIEKLTDYGDNVVPSWSPDGTTMAYGGHKYDDWAVYAMNLDRSGGEKNLVSVAEGGGCRPDWAPDRSRLAYVSSKDSAKSQIWLMGTDGSNKVKLTNDESFYHYFPAWNEDGSEIVYAKSPEHYSGNWDIWLMDADGSNHRKITTSTAMDKYPDIKASDIKPNVPPEAKFTCSPTEGLYPLTVTFDGTASTDSDGKIVRYVWSFGDTHMSDAGSVVTHTFMSKNDFKVVLTVTDDRGGISNAFGTVKTINIYSPVNQKYEKKITSGLFIKQHLYKVTWDRNSANDALGVNIVQYIIYRRSKTDFNYKYVDIIDAGENSFYDRFSQEPDTDYLYTVVSVDSNGRKSDISEN